MKKIIAKEAIMYLIQITLLLLGVAASVVGALLPNNLILQVILLCLGPSIIFFGAVSLRYTAKERKNGAFSASEMVLYSLPKTACLTSFLASFFCALLGYSFTKGSDYNDLRLAIILLVTAGILLLAPMFYICRKNRNTTILCSAIIIAISVIAAAIIISSRL